MSGALGARDAHLAEVIAQRRGRDRAPVADGASNLGPAPVTPTQRGLLVQGALLGRSINRPVAIAITGALDVAALERSLGAVIERHEPLRTRYDLVGGAHPQLIVEPVPEVALPVVEIGDDPELLRTELRLAVDCLHDPTAAPPVQWRLLRRSPTEHVLILALAHVCIDGWSEHVLVGDVAAIYAAATGAGQGLAPLAAGFGARALAACARLEVRSDSASARWAEALAGVAPVRLPGMAAVGDDGGGDHYEPITRRLDATLTASLRTTARAFGTTPFVVALAAMQRALAPMLGTDDFVIDCPVVNRTTLDEEALVGCLMGVAPIRTVPSGTERGRTITTLHQVLLEAIDNPLPADEIHHLVGHEDRSPLAPVVFQWRGFPAPEQDTASGVAFSSLPCPVPTSDTLAIDLSPTGDTVVLSVQHPGSKSGRATAEGVADGFVEALAALVEPTVDTDPAVVALSYAQERLWFLKQLDPEHDSYNEQWARVIDGPVDPVALSAAVRTVVERHHPLRTNIVQREGMPFGMLGPVPADPLRVIDLRHAPETVQACIDEIVAIPLDLATDPMLCSLLYRVGEERWVFAMVLHHIAFDGWSLRLMRNEITACYDAALEGREPDLPALPTSYPALAERERHAVKSEAFAPDLEFWDRALAAPLPSLPALGDGATRSVHSHHEPLPDTEALMRLRADLGLTRFELGLAVTAVMQARYGGVDDVLIGVTVANRPDPDMKPLVGMFTTMVPVRIRFDRERPFSEVARLVQQTLSDSRAHDRVPLDLVVSRARAQAPAARSEFFDSVFQAPGRYPGLAESDFTLAGAAARRLSPRIKQTAKFPLSVALYIDRPGRKDELEVNTYATHFTAAQTVAFGREWMAVLADAITDPVAPVRELGRRPAAGEKAHPARTTETVLDRIDALAEAAPGEPALEGAEPLCRSALIQRSNAVAAALGRNGIEPGATVAVLAQQAAATIVTMMGVWRAGASYVPLDPSQPYERALAALAPHGIDVLVLPDGNHGAFAGKGLRLLDVAAEATGRCDPAPAASLPQLPGPESTAYSITTSGTTGTPKLVDVPHRALAAFCAAAAERYGVEPTDRILQFHSLAFDACVEETWLPLFAGAVSVVPESRELGSLARLLAQVERLGITVLDLPTALWNEYCRHLSAPVALPASLRIVPIGGQAVDPEALANWQRYVQGEVRLVNGYGPTETTVTVASADLQDHDPSEPVPIGLPFEGCELRVVETSDGVGELWIGGPQLASGYRNDPQKTQAQFVGLDGRRWYRSGDRAVQLDDGRFRVHGRIDRQVKIDGHRIEPDEIEDLLRGLDGVEGAVVEVVGPPDAPALVAALEGTAEAAVVLATLRHRLPAAMVPTKLTVHDRLPRTSGSKYDRAAVRGWFDADADGVAADAAGVDATVADLGRGESDVASTPAAPPPEAMVERLCAIFAEVLGIDVVPPDANFFALGGRSLSAVRLVHLLAERLGVDLPVALVFDHPSPAELASHITDSGPTTPGPTPDRAVDPVPAAEAPDIVDPVSATEASMPEPLTPEQLGFWLHHQLREGDIPYTISSCLRLQGGLDADRLGRALRLVVDRQEVLRTTFGLGADGVPAQWVQPTPAQVLAVDLLDDLAPLDRPAAALERSRAFCRRPFDLAVDHPFRAMLVRVGADEHLLALHFHHIAVDGASVDIVRREVMEAYETGSVEAPVVVFREVSAAARSDSARLERSFGYWSDRLCAFVPPDLPGRAAHPRPTGSIGRHQVRLSPETTEALVALAEANGCTVFQVLVAASLALVHRTTGAPEVSVGTPVDARGSVVPRHAVGPFVNMVPLRVDIDDSATVADLLAATRLVVLEALVHGIVPFETIVERLNPQRDVARVPFFDLTCTLQEESPSTVRHQNGLIVEQVSMRQVEGGDGGAQDANGVTSDLMVAGRLSEAGLVLDLRHDVGILDADTVAQLARSLGVLLAALAADDCVAVADLALVDADEERWLLETLNDTAVDAPLDTGLDERFVQVARSMPTVPAVRHGDATITYADLDSRSSDLALELLRSGVRPGHAVGIRLDRSVDLVVAMLAVTRAGAAYVPVDADAPPARIERVLDLAGVTVTIAHGEAAAEMRRTYAGASLAISSRPGEPTVHTPDDGTRIAYIMFTSGSTGEPKGVVVPHRAVQRLVTSSTYADPGPGDIVGMLSNPAFDALTFEVWGALLNGATIDVVDRAVLLDPDAFANHIDHRRLTSMFITTSLFNQVIQARPDAFSTMRDVIVGGEALSVSAIRRCLEHPPQRLVNGYGPTETTTFACSHEIRSIDAGATSVPIGMPIANTTAHVLDAHGRLVPTGCVGELHVGGPGVALGYLGDPALTTTRFVTLDVAPGRFYRTGDLVRRRRDGLIEYVGRADDQVKLRGHRVELGEIQHALSAVHGIDAALASVVGAGANRRIVAHVAAAAAGFDSAVVRSELQSVLPGYMVPTEIVRLDRLPLTPQGKLDRQALASSAPSIAGRAAEKDDTTGVPVVTPRDDVSRVLDLYRRALERPTACADDDFFELGGHSLLAVELLGAVETTFGVRLPISTVFEARTPRRMAQRIFGTSDRPADPRIPHLVTLRDTGEGTPLWLVHPAGGSLVLYAPMVAAFQMTGRVFGVEAVGLDGAAPLTTVEAAADHQVVTITRVQPHGPYRLLGYSIGGVIAVETARRLRARGETVEFVGAIEAGLPTGEPRAPARHVKYRRLLRTKGWPGVVEEMRSAVNRRRSALLGNPVPAQSAHERAHLAVLDAMVGAFFAYRPQQLDLPVVLFLGASGSERTVSDLARRWGAFATGGVTVRRVSGSHDDDRILREEHAGALAAEIERALAEPGVSTWP